MTERWDELAAEGRTEAGWHVRRMQTPPTTSLYAALKLPGQSKGLLLVVRSRSVHASDVFPASSGFEVTIETVSPGPNGSVRICLELSEARYGEVFAVLADDVADAVIRSGSDREGVPALIGRLNTWQRFLKRHGDGLLSEEERTGLFAELYLLKEILAAGMAASVAVAAWRGPWAEAQDFRFRQCSVEVKAATNSGAATSLLVSNLVQLDERQVPCLLVRHFGLARAAKRGETLADMVDAIIGVTTTADPSAGIRFSDSLLELGYSPAHRAEYSREGYTVLSDTFFLVRDAFPRLRAGDVPAGVLACSYSLHLPACLPYLIDATEAGRLIHGDDR